MDIVVSCGTCPFFVALPPQPGTESTHAGLCHEGPGQMVALPSPTPGMGGFLIPQLILPVKKETDWCGRHPLFRLRAAPAEPMPPLLGEPRVLEGEP